MCVCVHEYVYVCLCVVCHVCMKMSVIPRRGHQIPWSSLPWLWATLHEFWESNLGPLGRAASTLKCSHLSSFLSVIFTLPFLMILSLVECRNRDEMKDLDSWFSQTCVKSVALLQIEFSFWGKHFFRNSRHYLTLDNRQTQTKFDIQTLGFQPVSQRKNSKMTFGRYLALYSGKSMQTTSAHSHVETYLQINFT